MVAVVVGRVDWDAVILRQRVLGRVLVVWMEVAMARGLGGVVLHSRAWHGALAIAEG